MKPLEWAPGHRRDITVGSVWRSRDPRDMGRVVTVVTAPPTISGGPSDTVMVKSARRSTMRTRTLLERYDLVMEVSR